MEAEREIDYQNLVSSNDDSSIQEEPIQEVTQQHDGSQQWPLRGYLNEIVPPWKLPLTCIWLVFCTASLVIILPVYLESVNISGDAYSAVLFVSLFTCLPLVLYNLIRKKYFCQFHQFGPASPLRILKYGIWHGISILVMGYALDRKRVLCHIQEPMMGLVIMYMIVVYFVYKGPELSSLRMLCLCGVLAGVFLSMDFQMNDIYKCHGTTRFLPSDDGGVWDPSTHTLWMIAFAAGLLLFTISWLWLERDILCRKDVGTHWIINTVSNNRPMHNAADTEALLDVNPENSSAPPFMDRNGGPLIPPAPSAVLSKWNRSMVWFLMASSLTVIFFLWTDCFAVLGKGNSWTSFANLTASGLACHFQQTQSCGPTALYGWLFLFFHVGFFLSLGQVFSLSGSIIFSMSVASLSLPLSSLWWSLFKIGGQFTMIWNPQVTGELIFSLLGFPLMLVSLFYWCHLDKIRKSQVNNFRMSSTCSINHV